MATRGPKPKPAAVRLLKGARARDVKKTAPKSGKLSATPPRWLSKTAKAKYRRMVKLLGDMGIVETADADMVAQYSQAWAEFVESTADIQERGQLVPGRRGELVLNPSHRARDRAWEKLKTLSPEFGLTPSSRMRLAAPKDDGKAEDPFELWANGAQSA